MNVKTEIPQVIGFQRCTLIIAFAVTALSWSGCMSVKFYIDPAFHTAAYRDVIPAATPIPVRVEFAFYRNEALADKAQPTVAKKVNRVFESTKVFRPDAMATSTLKVSFKNWGNIGEAAAKGLATGATFGLVGTHVVDHYTMELKFTSKAGKEFSGSYEHALHSTVGVKSPPSGTVPVNIADALDQVIEDQILRYLVDFQKWAKSQSGIDAGTDPVS
jgi:hypothetical protein